MNHGIFRHKIIRSIDGEFYPEFDIHPDIQHRREGDIQHLVDDGEVIFSINNKGRFL